MIFLGIIGMLALFFVGFIFLAGTIGSTLLARTMGDHITLTYWGLVFISLIPAFIARSKGRNFYLWWLYGWAVFLVACIHAIILKPTDNQLLKEGMVKCPYCAELIKSEAKICRYCGKEQVS